MELNLKRPLLFFDIESTGLNIATDGIIELSFVKVFPGRPEPEIRTWKVLPWDLVANRLIHMNPGASEVNGVWDKDLLDPESGRRKFIEILPEVAEWLRGSDLAGFNSAKFDLPLLSEEIERVRSYSRDRLDALEKELSEVRKGIRNGDAAKLEEKVRKAGEMLACIDGIDLHGCRMVDVQNIYHYMEPRNLRAAYRFYCGGKDFDNAHTAEADTLATYEVLKGQLDRYSQPDDFHQEVLQNDVDALSKVGGRNRTVDFAGRLILGDNGEPTISFGKHKGKTAREVWETEPAYFAWIEGGDFTLDTKAQFTRLKKQFEAERKAAHAARQAALDRPATEGEIDALRSKFSSGKLF